MVMRHWGRVQAGPGRSLAPGAVRAVLPAMATAAGAVVAVRTGTTQYAVVAPLVGLFTLVAAAVVGARLLADRAEGALSWGLALATVALLGASRLPGLPTGSDVSSLVVYPAALLCLAAALLTLPRPGVAAQQGDASWPRLGADALVACFAVLFFAGEHVFVPGLDWHTALPWAVTGNVVAVMLLVSAALLCLGRLRANGGPPLETVLALVVGATLCGAGDLAFLAHAVS